MNTLTPGRTDPAPYHDDGSGQSLADEQRLEAKARELAAESFDHQSDQARAWLWDAYEGEGTMRACFACKSVLNVAIWETSADVSLKVEHLREAFVDECAEDFLDDAAESLAAEDADAAADFEGEA